MQRRAHDRGRRLIASVWRVYYQSLRGLHTAGEVWYLRLPCFAFVALAENLDSASQTKFTEDFIRKMEEWEQKKFGQYDACRLKACWHRCDRTELNELVNNIVDSFCHINFSYSIRSWWPITTLGVSTKLPYVGPGYYSIGWSPTDLQTILVCNQPPGPTQLPSFSEVGNEYSRCGDAL